LDFYYYYYSMVKGERERRGPKVGHCIAVSLVRHNDKSLYRWVDEILTGTERRGGRERRGSGGIIEMRWYEQKKMSGTDILPIEIRRRRE